MPNVERLRNVVRALREDPDPENFTMRRIGYASALGKCGTPACALGHYAARTDLQGEFQLTKYALIYSKKQHRALNFYCETIRKHFDLNEAQFTELFEWHGCGNARTPEEAATYIERFIDRTLRTEAR